MDLCLTLEDEVRKHTFSLRVLLPSPCRYHHRLWAHILHLFELGEGETKLLTILGGGDWPFIGIFMRSHMRNEALWIPEVSVGGHQTGYKLSGHGVVNKIRMNCRGLRDSGEGAGKDGLLHVLRGR